MAAPLRPPQSDAQPKVFAPPNMVHSSQKSKTLRLKQASHDPVIMQLWNELLELFSSHSNVWQSLQNTEHRQIHSARILDGFALSTLYKYMGTIKNFVRTCEDLERCFLSLSESEMADALVTIRLAKSSDCTGATCTSTIKALRWFKRTADLTTWTFLYGSLINSFLTVKIPKDRRESAPFSLWIVMHLERKLLQTRCESHLVLVIGSVLMMIWGSLRFSDVQRAAVKTFCYNGKSLRGMLWRTKVSCKSQPFGVISRGLLSHGDFSWMHRFLLELDSLLATNHVEDLDFLIPHIQGDGTIPIPLEPMSYACMLSWLRFILNIPWKSHERKIPVSSYTVHSCKTTVLSWAAQLPQGVVSSEQRHLQGHHSYQSSMRLYSRDDVHGALQLQSVMVEHIQKGFRPVQPIHRGGQEAFPSPAVVLERFSKSCDMTEFRWFNFLDEAESIEEIPDGETAEEESSSSSSSSDSELSDAAQDSTKTISKHLPNDTIDEFWYGVTKLTVHAMIKDDNPSLTSALLFQGTAVKTACGRRMSISSIQVKEDLQNIKVPSFCQHPGCRRAWDQA